MSVQRIMTGLVVENNDPENLGRVRLVVPALPDGPELWARVVSPLAGPDRGLCFLPEIEDEVLVTFTQGDLSSAYVLGALWGAKKQPPDDVGEIGNDIKSIKTRSGHLLEFDDTDGFESITIRDYNDNTITIETYIDRITIKSHSDIEISADEQMMISADDIIIEAKDISIKADSSFTLDGGASAEIKAGTISLN